MAHKHFVARCLLDGLPHPQTGEPYLLHVTTHGKKSHVAHKAIKTAADALEHFQHLATRHRIEDEDGVRYVHHISADGEEHKISNIEPVEEYDVNKHGFDPGNRAPPDVLAAVMKSSENSVPLPKAPAIPPEVLAATLKPTA